jgi:hypothetical protein
MSIELTTQVLKIQGLSQSEKHILTVLCFLSNQYHEVYRSIEKLSKDCSCSIKTIERSLKKFRDIGFLSYTGKKAPKSKNIPIYKIDLNYGLTGGDTNLTTDNSEFNHGHLIGLTTPSVGIRKDNKYKDNKKDIDFFMNENREKSQNIKYCIRKGEKIPDDHQFVYLFMKENNLV